MSNVFEIDDEIVAIEYLGEEETIDINVSGNRLFYANDILTHNSAVEESDHNQAMIAGGISKIQTADNVISLFSTTAMRDRGEYHINFLKTRSSSGVGSKVVVGFDQSSLRITNLDPDLAVENPDSSSGFVSEKAISSDASANTFSRNIKNKASKNKKDSQTSDDRTDKDTTVNKDKLSEDSVKMNQEDKTEDKTNKNNAVDLKKLAQERLAKYI